MEEWSGNYNQTGQCAPLLSPVVGTLKLVAGNGTSIGTVITLQCPFRHRAVGGSRVSCVWSSNNTQWSGGIPECKPLSQLSDESFRLALLLSFVSSAIILFMSIIFITSCLVSYVRQEERRNTERKRKREGAELWQQMDIQGLELQTETLLGQKGRNNNNNNNNTRGERQHSTTTNNQIFSHGNLLVSCRCHQHMNPVLQNIHPYLSLRPKPPTDHLTNTYITPNSCELTPEDRNVCREVLEDALWNRQHLFGPHTPPVQVISI